MAYDPNYYQTQSYSQQQYVPANYAPHGDRQLSQSRLSPQPAYPNSQSLTPYHPPSPHYSPRASSRDERYLYVESDHDRPRRRHRSHSRRSHRSRSRSRSRSRDLGSALLGAAGGGFLGHKYGGGALGAIGGAVAGAVGANLADKEWEKHKEKRGGLSEREYQEEKGGFVGKLLHPEETVRRARSKVRGEVEGDYDSDEERAERRRRRRDRREREGRARSEGGYYEEEVRERRYRG
ncbi:MAG: hypothetical protein L6R40_007080 [Gallowayella cf. fulva]|nr:MAG: hypothetical protein L6R40_007080 [Xanthomendoza cf. fulva]